MPCFFFQAEDGIRDRNVTGVQTCALPIYVENPSDIVSEGDTLTLEVKKISDEEVIVSKKLIDAREAWKDLQVKYDSQETFTTEIKEVVKGGLAADVGLRGFIPASLVE